MVSEKEIIDQLMKSVTENVTLVIQDSLSGIVQKEISKALANALFEGEFYRGVNSEVLTGIENIFTEISSFKKNLSATSDNSPGGLLDCSTSLLDQIINSTERATLNILDHLDQMQILVQEARKVIEAEKESALQVPFNNMEALVTDIMTELSFQDLTGQKIRMVIKSLTRVEELVYEVYLTSEALKKSKEKSPKKDIEDLKQEARELVQDFKNKGSKIEQGEIDTLFSEYGL